MTMPRATGETITHATRIAVGRRIKFPAPPSIGSWRVERGNSASNRIATGHAFARRHA
jgi:hypothetical protein